MKVTDWDEFPHYGNRVNLLSIVYLIERAVSYRKATVLHKYEGRDLPVKERLGCTCLYKNVYFSRTHM